MNKTIFQRTRNENFKVLSTAKCGMHKSIKLNYFELINILESCNQPGGRSQNTVPIASTQVAIKGIVQYSTRAQFLIEQLATRHSREHMLSAVSPDTQVE